MTPVRQATDLVANKIASNLARDNTPLTYWACRQHLDRMAKGARNAMIISGMCNLRTLRTAVAARLAEIGRQDLAAGAVQPTPQQRVWLQQIDDGNINVIPSVVTIRRCTDNGWVRWDADRFQWVLTSTGRDAARGERDYWAP